MEWLWLALGTLAVMYWAATTASGMLFLTIIGNLAALAGMPFKPEDID